MPSFSRIAHLIILSLSISFSGWAATLRGKIMDAKTGEPLPGAIVTIKGTQFNAIAGLDGNYSLKNVPAGTHQISAHFISYAISEKTIVIDSDIVVVNFSMEENQTELSEVVVVGVLDRESEQSVRRAEQKADNVINIMSANAIQLLPDLTVGNLMQRVSGVSIERNGSGDGHYAIIRGMDKRYNYTLVNGIKIPSPDNKNRYVPLDIFPADLLERLEVIKVPTPSMEGDAVGGAMNMVMKSPPPSLKIAATMAGGFSNMFASRPFAGFNTSSISTKSPEELYGPKYPAKPSDFSINQLEYTNKYLPINSLMSFSIGNTVLNKKLGFIVAASYQNIYRGTNSIFYKPSEPQPLPQPNTFRADEIQFREFSTHQKRLGIHAKVDYYFNQKNKLSLYNLFVRLDEAQHRHYHNPFPNLVLDSGMITSDIHDRSRFTTQRIYNSTLRGDHALSNSLKLDWTFAYSTATSNTPGWSDMNVRYRYDSGKLNSVTLLPVSQQWTHNKDVDYTGYVNLTHSLKDNLEIAAGGMARFKARENIRAYYELNTVVSGSSSNNYEPYTSIDKAVFNFFPNSTYISSSEDPNNYKAKEIISGIYIQGKYIIANRLQLLGGVRNEFTHQEYQSHLSILLPGRDGEANYSELLPSLNIKYALNEKQNLRLAYYKAISRPNYFEYVPVIIPGDNWDEEGNYKIKHSTADNYDFRYELFSNGNDQVLAGAFFKNIYNPIEFGLDPKGVSSYSVKPYNYGTATNYGLELVLAKYIKNFGISVNYTYTNSSITTGKLLVISNGTKPIVSQTRPLQGQSKHIGNVSLIYKNTKLGLDAQLSMVYTGRRINFVSPFKDLDYWQRDFVQLDFSAEKRVFKKFQWFVKITNLLDAALISEVINPNVYGTGPDGPAQDRSDRIVVQRDAFHQTFLTGLRYKFQ